MAKKGIFILTIKSLLNKQYKMSLLKEREINVELLRARISKDNS